MGHPFGRCQVCNVPDQRRKMRRLRQSLSQQGPEFEMCGQIFHQRDQELDLVGGGRIEKEKSSDEHGRNLSPQHLVEGGVTKHGPQELLTLGHPTGNSRIV